MKLLNKLVLILLINILPLKDFSQQLIDDKLAEADKYVDAGKYDEALALYSGIINEYQQEIEKYIESCKVHELKRLDSLYAETWQPLQGERGFSRAYCGKGVTLLKIGKPEEAQTMINKAIQLDYSYGEPYNMLADIMLSNKSKEAACMYYALAKKYDSKTGAQNYETTFCWELSRSYLKEGKIRKSLKQYEVAINKFDTAMRIDPNNAEIYFHLADIYLDKEENKTALKFYNKSIALDSLNVDCYFNRAEVFFRLNKFQEAFDDFTMVVKFKPGYNVFMKRAMICEAMKNYRSADFDYTSAIKYKPEEGEAYYKRAMARKNLPDYNEMQVCEDLMKASELLYDQADQYIEDCTKKKKIHENKQRK